MLCTCTLYSVLFPASRVITLICNNSGNSVRTTVHFSKTTIRQEHSVVGRIEVSSTYFFIFTTRRLYFGYYYIKCFSMLLLLLFIGSLKKSQSIRILFPWVYCLATTFSDSNLLKTFTLFCEKDDKIKASVVVYC